MIEIGDNLLLLGVAVTIGATVSIKHWATNRPSYCIEDDLPSSPPSGNIEVMPGKYPGEEDSEMAKDNTGPGRTDGGSGGSAGGSGGAGTGPGRTEGGGRDGNQGGRGTGSGGTK